ncbi:hypothetical protein ACFL6D_04160, partial [Spirochaetota bacterium]
ELKKYTPERSKYLQFYRGQVRTQVSSADRTNIRILWFSFEFKALKTGKHIIKIPVSSSRYLQYAVTIVEDPLVDEQLLVEEYKHEKLRLVTDRTNYSIGEYGSFEVTIQTNVPLSSRILTGRIMLHPKRTNGIRIFQAGQTRRPPIDKVNVHEENSIEVIIRYLLIPDTAGTYTVEIPYPGQQEGPSFPVQVTNSTNGKSSLIDFLDIKSKVNIADPRERVYEQLGLPDRTSNSMKDGIEKLYYHFNDYRIVYIIHIVNNTVSDIEEIIQY